ncbi:hypothetical protein PCANC_09047 [Puccinia coronata f. sp. avenae]|uniref:Uncharacterized protein n=1 Tax=Puccinia coronata f. sp. avenae TaxID=200324 RepID=A0A2N5T236_9BASI|nr:hypothetical protein PCANC_09047 [Puccinia coronata f. sp. avenae]
MPGVGGLLSGQIYQTVACYIGSAVLGAVKFTALPLETGQLQFFKCRDGLSTHPEAYLMGLWKPKDYRASPAYYGDLLVPQVGSSSIFDMPVVPVVHLSQ